MNVTKILAVALGWIICVPLFADEIRLLTWEEYFSSELISEFEQQTGHTLKQVYFESEALRDQVVYSGKAKAYDLFIIDGYTLQQLGEEGVLSRVDRSLAEGNFSKDSVAACKDYGVPYSFGSIGIGYRGSKVDKTFNSWMDVFDYAKENPNTVVMPDEDLDTAGIALMALGYHPMSTSENELKEAYQLLDGVVGSLLAFRNTLGYAMDKGADSSMDVSVFYSGEKEQISIATNQDDWEYVIPTEGTLMWYECFSSHVDRPINEATRSFLNFINKPQNAINNAQSIWFATTNNKALKLAENDYLKDSELFPKVTEKTKNYSYDVIDEKSQQIRANIINILSSDK
ncbi:extracellular solute-binding protein [Vibrio lamellibrachiae]|uniref:extracellular solute-binding protein n=1 Tax=Vibrio lamellibrachiae TaxID=2910253 RepID=UPI003D103467